MGVVVDDLRVAIASRPILHGVHLEVRDGQRVGLVGPSGSGKSTFLRCMNLLETPTSGQIIVEGTDITDKKVDINLHRQKMGMVFQQFNLFPHLTVMENITLAPTKLKKIPQAQAEKEGR